MNRTIPLNEEAAADVLAGISDPITRNLVQMAIAHVRMQFIRRPGESEDEWVRRLPAAPFDVRFFTSVLAEVFSHSQTIKALLDGQPVAEATGWDI